MTEFIPERLAPRVIQPQPFDAVIVDVDGTLVDVSTVRHHVLKVKSKKDFRKFHEESRKCPPHVQAVEFARRHFNAGRFIIVVTARKYEWMDLTMDWLIEHLVFEDGSPIPFIGPFMRGDDDDRKDREVKADIYRILTKDLGYRIVSAIDDNPKIIELWEDLGIPVIETVPGWDEEAAAQYVAQAVRHE